MDTNEKIQAVKDWLVEVRANAVPVSLWEPDKDPWDACWFSFKDGVCMLRASHSGTCMIIDSNGARFTTSSIPLSMPIPFDFGLDGNDLYNAMLVMKPLYEAELNKSNSEMIQKIDAEIAVLMKKKEALNDKV